ncbi:MAG: DNA repair protein RecN [Spirochaetaceae bacterium]|jgi:DNA repair protein RecN (Recombination protein N)|nr:DNA repair protein RecN [Spirochaetaceae bacterium]
MLLELVIRNWALIDSLNVSFEGGLNIITGETGAGKSIIVGAISFLLGAKADAEVIRTGCEEASVSAVLKLPDYVPPELASWFAERDIAPDNSSDGASSAGGEIIVRRVIRRNGRGSIFIQNIPVNRNDLEECMSFLFDIHGQHAHESLLRPINHRKYLDRFAGLEEQAAAFNALFRELQDKRKIAENAITSEKERAARQEILSYIIDEIEKAALKPGETRTLEAESSRLASFEKLAGYIETAYETFCGSASALPLIRKTQSAMQQAASLDGALESLAERISSLFYEAEDISRELKDYRANLSFDPERLEQVEERLAFINKLKKKYAAKPDAREGELALASVEDLILERKAEAERELDALSQSEENREALKKEITALERTLFEKARILSAGRSAAAAELSSRISVILKALGMPAARFGVRLEAKGGSKIDDGGLAGGAAQSTPFVIGPYGADDVEFLFSANLGEEERELARIASGGELSRVMLAIKTALVAAANAPAESVPADGISAGDTSAGTLIFDEIDTGIGGEVAIAVGDYLSQIGAAKQIFCVTHLAVIAAKADNHLKVEKKERDGRTVTQLRTLQAGERREEIARLLSGDLSGAALAHADKLLERR